MYIYIHNRYYLLFVSPIMNRVPSTSHLSQKESFYSSNPLSPQRTLNGGREGVVCEYVYVYVCMCVCPFVSICVCV